MSVIVQSISTVVLLIAFVALWIRAWSKERRTEYAAVANMPLEEISAQDEQHR
jgi:cbb3-type cytochrome oxidase subunit 3